MRFLQRHECRVTIQTPFARSLDPSGTAEAVAASAGTQPPQVQRGFCAEWRIPSPAEIGLACVPGNILMQFHRTGRSHGCSPRTGVDHSVGSSARTTALGMIFSEVSRERYGSGRSPMARPGR